MRFKASFTTRDHETSVIMRFQVTHSSPRLIIDQNRKLDLGRLDTIVSD